MFFHVCFHVCFRHSLWGEVALGSKNGWGEVALGSKNQTGGWRLEGEVRVQAGECAALHDS